MSADVSKAVPWVIIVDECSFDESGCIAKTTINLNVIQCTPDWQPPTGIEDKYTYYIGISDELVISFAMTNGDCLFSSTFTSPI